MPNSFSIDRSHLSSFEDPELRSRIQSHTGNEAATSSILRSLERFGIDASIRSYEVTPRGTRRTHARASDTVSWTVHAVRL